MTRPRKPVAADRRAIVFGSAAAAALFSLLSRSAPASAQAAPQPAPPAPNALDQAIEKIIGDAKPIPGKILVEMPEIAENGNTVPYAISIESAMTPTDHVKAIHVLATANPLPVIAQFKFTELSGRAAVASRMRLAKSQDVIVLAELSSGQFISTRRTVKVTIGGCGG